MACQSAFRIARLNTPRDPGSRSPLADVVVDPDRMLSRAIANEGLEVIARRNTQVLELNCCVDRLELASRDSEQVRWKPLEALPVKHFVGHLVLEGPDHLSFPLLVGKDHVQENISLGDAFRAVGMAHAASALPGERAPCPYRKTQTRTYRCRSRPGIGKRSMLSDSQETVSCFEFPAGTGGYRDPSGSISAGGRASYDLSLVRKPYSAEPPFHPSRFPRRDGRELPQTHPLLRTDPLIADCPNPATPANLPSHRL